MAKQTSQMKISKKRQQVTLEPEDIKIIAEKRAESGNPPQTAAVRAILREWKKWDTEIKEGRLVRAK